jgi:hypothetical protein
VRRDVEHHALSNERSPVAAGLGVLLKDKGFFAGAGEVRRARGASNPACNDYDVRGVIGHEAF